MYGALGEEVQRDKSLKLEPVLLPGTEWILFTEIYDPKSPWHDTRVRQAANYAINRQAINEAETLGHSVLSGSIIRRQFDFVAPLWEFGFLCASGPRVAVSSLGSIPLFAYTAPYEEVRLKYSHNTGGVIRRGYAYGAGCTRR